MANMVLINAFEVPPEQPDEEFLAGWQRAADYMSAQRGFVGSRLHRAVSPDPRFRFINVAEWESPQHFQAAVASEEFRKLGEGSPANYPALYEVVRTV
jgi:heme-degrading monooxygenase HmoA